MAEPKYRPALIACLREYAQPPDKFSHQPRLYALARQLAESQPFDDDMLFAAAWMHDLGVFNRSQPKPGPRANPWSRRPGS